MGSRRLSRELALKALFCFDIKEQDSDMILEDFCSNFQEEIKSESKDFFLFLFKGVIEHIEEINFLLDKYSKNWRISRMPLVDRNIMRIAIFEYLQCSDIPMGVTIDEAVEIGKKYGTQDSGAFINGVLDCIFNIGNLKKGDKIVSQET